jgi:hypothetical protein
MAINILDYLKELELGRHRGVVIHTIPANSEILTQFALRVSKKGKGKYIDLLDQFIQSKMLKENIEIFRPEKMHNYFIENSKNETLLIVDRVDFLLDTWKKKDREIFYQIVLDQWDGYKEDTSSKLIICLQTSTEIYNLKNIVSRIDHIFQLDEFREV